MSNYRRRRGSAFDQLRELLGDRPTIKLAPDAPRDRCERCDEPSSVILTVIDAMGHESAVCASCWRACEADRMAVAERSRYG